MNDNSKTAKKLTGSIIAVIVLAICLCITTFALVWATVSVDNNLFHTGTVKINLNDGKPVIAPMGQPSGAIIKSIGENLNVMTLGDGTVIYFDNFGNIVNP